MALNRAAQKRVLEHLAVCYPHRANAKNLAMLEMPEETLTPQLAYLEEHGLVVCTWTNNISAQFQRCTGAVATAKGMDFLENDGGLSAILGVVTIKIHDDTIKQLIASRIQESDLAPADKQKLTGLLHELPAETTKHLALKLVDKALEASPQAIQWLQTQLLNVF